MTLSPTALAGRVALVTGAGRPDGIGAAVARMLALAGASVALADLPVGADHPIGAGGDHLSPVPTGVPRRSDNSAGPTAAAPPTLGGTGGETSPVPTDVPRRSDNSAGLATAGPPTLGGTGGETSPVPTGVPRRSDNGGTGLTGEATPSLSPAPAGAGRHGLNGVVAGLREMGLRVVALEGDVRRESDCEALVQACREALGGCDILVNNAAAPHGADRADIADVPVGAFDEQVDVNLRAAFLLARSAVPGMRERGWGRIVNVASIAALAAVRHRAAYSASKAGLLGLTRALAVDVAADGITVNAVCPGLITTSRNLEGTTDSPWEQSRSLYDRSPVGRPGRPDDVAGAVAFFVSDLASYVTGESLLVDGGLGVALTPA